jgi:hypothetical protein
VYSDDLMLLPMMQQMSGVMNERDERVNRGGVKRLINEVLSTCSVLSVDGTNEQAMMAVVGQVGGVQFTGWTVSSSCRGHKTSHIIHTTCRVDSRNRREGDGRWGVLRVCS